MKSHTIPLGRILGIPIGLDYSWFLIFVLLTWSLAVSYYPLEFRNWPVIQYWVLGAVTAIMLFVSVLLHELGHSFIAMRYKINVRRITLFIFGGVAEITSEPPKASAEFWIAIAGPVVSFALAVIFKIMESLAIGVPQLWALLKYLALINGALVLFNLIPGFPLDGGRVFRAIVWGITRNFRRATFVAATVGRFFAFLFIFAGVLQIFTGNLINGLWIAFIGWFLESAAVSQVQQQALLERLTGHTVSEAMNRDYVTIPADTTLQELVDHHILGSGRRCFVIKRNEAFVGFLTLHRIKDAPREKWSTTTVADIMIPETEMKWMKPQAQLWEALQEMDRDGVNQLPVREDGQVVGLLSRESIITFLRTLQELGL